MSNKEEWNRILQIIGDDACDEDKEFKGNCVRKFNFLRTIFYIVVFGSAFYIFQGGRLIPHDSTWLRLIVVAILLTEILYLKQKRVLHRELNRYAFRECRPDKGLSRYLSFVPTTLNKQMLWSVTKYNFGSILYRLGKIDKASKCLGLMQEASATADNMLIALHLKQLIALYYNDYDTVKSCADEGCKLYPKARHSIWNFKIYKDLQLYRDYAYCCINNDYEKIYTVLGTPQERPLDEVARQYYLYLTAKKLGDIENAEKYKKYISENAGTTWYGKAVEADFIPEEKPNNYPGYVVSDEKLHNPSKVDRERLKYLLIGVLIVLLFYYLPRLF